MIRVAIETATALGTVAVARDDVVLAEVELGVQRRHAESVVPALADALERAGVGRADIGEVVVGAGPGSFTGVRVAGATAKGLAAGLDLPLVAYPSLLALATSAAVHGDAPGAGRPVLALFDARRGEVYGGCWRVDDDGLVTILAPTVGPVEAVVAEAVANARRAEAEAAGAEGAEIVVVGDGALRYADRLAGTEVLEQPVHPRAAALLWLAARHRRAGAVDDPAAWEPLYVRSTSYAVPKPIGAGGGDDDGAA